MIEIFARYLCYSKKHKPSLFENILLEKSNDQSKDFRTIACNKKLIRLTVENVFPANFGRLVGKAFI